MSYQRTTPLVVAVAFLLLIPAAAYVGSYLAFGRTITTYSYPGGIFGMEDCGLTGGRVNSIHRFYDAEWQVAVFAPVGKLEATVRGIVVETRQTPEGVRR
jgi:hypothetical protein